MAAVGAREWRRGGGGGPRADGRDLPDRGHARSLMTYGATLGYFAKLGIPLPDVVLPLTIALEIGGACLLVARAGA